LILTNNQCELIDKSTIISTRRWTNGLGTAHSNLGGPTFVNEKVVHTLQKKNNVLPNFKTKVRRISLWAFKLILTNIHSEMIVKSTIISTRRWITVLAQPTQRWAALLLSIKKWFTNSKKNNVELNFETKEDRLSL